MKKSIVKWKFKKEIVHQKQLIGVALFQSVKFKRKTPVPESLIFNRCLLGNCNFNEKEIDWYFPVNFAKFFGTPRFKVHLQWLLLDHNYSVMGNLEKMYLKSTFFFCKQFACVFS